MNQHVGHQSSAFASGLLFGAGLVISGMTQPEKVLGFLDPFGRFDASLMFVMVGAIAVHFIAYRLRTRRSAPLYSAKFLVPTRSDVDTKLLAGAFIFGIGWGLGGYCPGPGIVSLAGGGLSALAFVSAMLLGVFATMKTERLFARKKPADDAAQAHTATS